MSKGVQMWRVPATGTYSIEAAGASGGYDKFSGGRYQSVNQSLSKHKINIF